MTTEPLTTSRPPATGLQRLHPHIPPSQRGGSVPSLFLSIFQMFYEPYFKKILFLKKK